MTSAADDNTGSENASGPRAIDHSMDIGIEDVTVEACLDACAAAGFSVAGIQFGEVRVICPSAINVQNVEYRLGMSYVS